MVKHNGSEELKKANLKATPARLGILSALDNTDTPLDVAEITEYLKKNKVKADRATVFRVMNTLSEKGLVKPIQLHENKLRYESAFSSEHHHFICESCGMISDISDCNISDLEENIHKKKGLLIKRHSLEFFGLCANCQK